MSRERRSSDIWSNLYLVRHGESTANEINRFAGSIDAPLTQLGITQAREAGHSWNGETLDRVYVSPLTRAQQTAQILLDTLSDAAPPLEATLIDERIRERHFGDFTLQNKTRLQRRFGLNNYEASLYQSDASLHGGEDFEGFRRRVLDFLRSELYPALASGQKVLVVAHKYVIELLSLLILRLPDAEGYDLRLPNARILPGNGLQKYVRAESAERNRLRDGIVVHHSLVLAAAAGIGLAWNALGSSITPQSWWLLALLFFSTTISVARVSFRNPTQGAHSDLLPANRLLLRFVAFPWILLALGVLAWPQAVIGDGLMALVILLAAPTAVTAITLSRSAGGVVLPSVLMILFSTVLSTANTIGLLAWFGMSELTLQALIYAGLSIGSLVLPILLVYPMRRFYPITTAHFAENHASTAVIALAVFVVLAFQNIPLSSFFDSGLLALAIGLSLRLAAVRIARHLSLYGVDDYFSMSYPNIFLVILLGGLLGNAMIVELATWFLLPMFALAPLDDLLIRRMQDTQPQFDLTDYLRISPQSMARTGSLQSVPINRGTVMQPIPAGRISRLRMAPVNDDPESFRHSA